MIVFEALEAKHGDSLLLRYQQDGEDRLWVIDGGPRGVLKKSLAPRLAELRGEAETLRVDLAMVSHIDDDHIAGMVQMTNELVRAKDAGKPLALDIQQFWHNGFKEIVGGGDLSGIKGAAAEASMASAADDLKQIAAKFGITDTAGQLVLASVGQGVELVANIESLEIPLNESFDRRIEAPQTREFAGTKILFLGPLKNRLDALKQEWANATTSGDIMRLVGLFADKLDESIPNLSSISMLVEIGNRKLLLTGDARGDDMVDGWKAAGRDPDTPFPVDILKMPHHASDRNLTEKFLQLFPADHYVISADGRHDNPDLKTITGMAQVLGNRAYTVHITNRNAAMKAALDALEAERTKPGRKFKVRFRDPDALSVQIALD
jgi:beta-lactamase superfamily II metal-dependent hydrolase